MKRLIFLGGSFDPVHLGHLALAEWVQQEEHPDHFLFVPSFRNPLKDNPAGATPRQRLAMLEIAVRGTRFTIFPGDLETANTRTLKTVEHLRRRYGSVELQMVIGEDLLDQLPSWYAWEELCREISFLILPRWGAGTGEPPPQHRRLNAPRLEISSSLVRRRLAAGYTMEHWLPPGVWAYIRKHELYGWHEK